MFCSKCGKEISDKDKYCPYCGCEISQNEKSGNESSDLQQKEAIQTPVQEKRVDKTIGVLSLVFAFIFPLVGLIISIIGLVKYKDKENKSLCTVGLIISGIDIILYFGFSIFLMMRIIGGIVYMSKLFF